MPSIAYLRPYVELARLHKPAAILLIFWPFVWSLTMASFRISAPINQYISNIAVYSLVATITRGSACTMNDIIDCHIDAGVERTKSRPIPSGRISVWSAMIFMVVQLIIGTILFSRFLQSTALQTSLIQLMPISIVYPFLKRYTNWPQAWLGIGINLGLVTAWTGTTGLIDGPVLSLLFMSCWCWTIYYDTVYAFQDVRDDKKMGVHSTAVLFGNRGRPLLLIFASLFIVLLSAAGYMNSQGWFFYCISVGGASVHLLWQWYTVDLDTPESCTRVFARNSHLGWLIWAGLMCDYYWCLAQAYPMKLKL